MDFQMKNILLVTVAATCIGFTACKKSDFADSYSDPSKVAEATVERQFAGVITSYTWTNPDKGQHGYIVPQYWNYFVIMRSTVLRYTQATGWANDNNQYVPGAASVGDYWKDYFYMLAQYRVLQNLYAKQPAIDQELSRIYMIAAAIFFYDQTQKMIDLYGDIPWSDAGKINENKGDYIASLAKYDDAAAIYTKMLDDLKAFADELNTIDVETYIQAKFAVQDLVNRGDIRLWKKYCNSLRLKMLTRVSGAPAFQSRANTEMATIFADPVSYPVVDANAANIKINVYQLGSDINAKSFKNGLEGDDGWPSNIAGKAMIDHMNTNNDPRLRAMFEPGAKAFGAYNGLDPLLNGGAQTSLINGGTMAIYNRSTLSRNVYFPGIIINAAEVSFLKAEYYLKTHNDAQAQAAYETGIQQSIEYYYWLRTFSTDNTAGSLTPTNGTEISNYINKADVKWNASAPDADKLKLIATQKWLHFSVVQPYESWAEIRRLDAPALGFLPDAGNAQTQPPYRWIYPNNERLYNPDNYAAVKPKDNLTTRIFWDLN
jgi:hypothetical protein